MNTITLVAIDLAKSSFHIHAVTESGRRVTSKAVRRKHLFETVVKLAPKYVAFEACGSSHYWAQRFIAEGFEVRMIPAQFVKPFVKTNKSDKADAEAIAIAALHPCTRFVPVKSLYQQDMQALHKERERLITNRTALCNQLRAILSERGEITSQGRSKLIDLSRELLERESQFVSGNCKIQINRLLREYSMINELIEEVETQISRMASEQDDCRRLQEIPGVGLITATALVAAIGDKSQFKSGRHLAAWIGLTPRHSGTGGKTRILGMSKRGNPMLRRLLIQGASSSLRWVDRREDHVSRWASQVKERRGVNKAKVALANKTARIIYAVLCKGQDFRLAA